MSKAYAPQQETVDPPGSWGQLTLLESPLEFTDDQLGVTFQDSRKEPVHRWYPYVEGFSAPYVRGLIEAGGYGSVYDPFGGAGTTQLTAATSGIASFYAEVNPFMAYVAETKVNGGRWARQHLSLFTRAAATFKNELTAWGALTRSQAAAASYSWMSPPSNSRRRITAADGGKSSLVEGILCRSGACKSSARCGLCSL